jgi:hypothetical protein
VSIDGTDHADVGTTISGTVARKYDNALHAIKEICKKTGRDFWVERTATDTYTLKTQNQRTRNTSYSVPNQIVAKGGKSIKVTREESGVEKMYNQVRVIGQYRTDTKDSVHILVPYRNPTDKNDTVCVGTTDANIICVPTREECTGTSGSNPGCIHSDASSSQEFFGVKEARPIIDRNIKDINVAIKVAQAFLDSACGWNADTSTFDGVRALTISSMLFKENYQVGEWIHVVDTTADINVVGRIEQIKRSWNVGRETFEISVFNPFLRTEDVLSQLRNDLITVSNTVE